MKKLLVTLLKIAVSIGILAYLVVDAQKDPEAFGKLRDDPKNWLLLLGAFAFCMAGVVLTLVRWWYLARALEVPLSFRDAMRIGFLGYLFNLAPMGIVGGDLLKAWMLAREHRQYKIKAFASVIVDRVIGLFLLFVVASAAILLTGAYRHPNPDIRWVSWITIAVTAGSAAALLVLLTPGFTEGRGTRALGRLPRVGPAIRSMVDAVRMYGRRPDVLLGSSVMSVGVHSLFTIGIYLIGRGLPDCYLGLGQTFFVATLSAAASIIPLPAGPQEGALQYLYNQLLELPAKGLVMGLTYRLITVLIAAVGVCYYLGSRREVAEMMRVAEQEQQAIA